MATFTPGLCWKLFSSFHRPRLSGPSEALGPAAPGDFARAHQTALDAQDVVRGRLEYAAPTCTARPLHSGTAQRTSHARPLAQQSATR